MDLKNDYFNCPVCLYYLAIRIILYGSGSSPTYDTDIHVNYTDPADPDSQHWYSRILIPEGTELLTLWTQEYGVDGMILADFRTEQTKKVNFMHL